MLYALLKAVHRFGVVRLVGTVIVTLVWKLGADRTGEPSVIAFGQRLITLTDKTSTSAQVLMPQTKGRINQLRRGEIHTSRAFRAQSLGSERSKERASGQRPPNRGSRRSG
ncbi:DUF2269 family protein [Lamprobacter modestohalophilus]|uniref:DUF2269 family protein n=1 Tax=Lamprobacter modestohalophilus TaxID=1064514 RepID=UPI002ADEAD09|nr:DUF2269 family protein [Lamprobacter modestohalophilus]MEA1052081.1 DUF2269 family protein [Lamprobacter modestohalophilus]